MQCPQCQTILSAPARRCPKCQADLDLLADLADRLRIGLDKADSHLRDGNLHGAMWSYLHVLETDPDNPLARRQVAQVVTAVRQFDLSTPERRKAAGLPPEVTKGALWRRTILGVVVGALLFTGTFSMGFLAGMRANWNAPPEERKDPPAADNAMGGRN